MWVEVSLILLFGLLHLPGINLFAIRSVHYSMVDVVSGIWADVYLVGFGFLFFGFLFFLATAKNAENGRAQSGTDVVASN